MEKYFIV